MPTIDDATLNLWTSRVTAFSSLRAFRDAMAAGYVPTLRKSDPEQAALGMALANERTTRTKTGKWRINWT
jgi:hypothetical protein